MSGKRLYGCLFCLSGDEDDVMLRLKRQNDLPVISPVRQHYFRRKGEFSIHEDRVFPGYIFFYTDDADYPARDLAKADGVVRLVCYDSEEWVLQGEDAAMAEDLFRCNGVIGLSKGYFEKGRLRITEGFLKPYEKDIRKVDRRHRAAMIKITMNNREVELWLGYELVDPPK